jgi:hypothetical protein
MGYDILLSLIVAGGGARMNDFLGLFWSIRGITRSLILLFVGIYLVLGQNVLTDGKIALFDMFIISQNWLGYFLCAVSIAQLVFAFVNFFGRDFSSEFAGVYRASFGYDVEGLKGALSRMGHPAQWGEGKTVICPIHSGADEWAKANHEEMSEVDKRIDPESPLYREFSDLKTELSYYLRTDKANPARQVYSFSGFGIVTDEQASRKGKHSSYVNLLTIDPRYQENKIIFDSIWSLIKFIFSGSRLVIRIDQRISAHCDTSHPLIPVYLHIRLRYRPWIGLFVDGPGVIYLNLVDRDRFVVNTYTVDGSLR